MAFGLKVEGEVGESDGMLIMDLVSPPDASGSPDTEPEQPAPDPSSTDGLPDTGVGVWPAVGMLGVLLASLARRRPRRAGG